MGTPLYHSNRMQGVRVNPREFFALSCVLTADLEHLTRCIGSLSLSADVPNRRLFVSYVPKRRKALSITHVREEEAVCAWLAKRTPQKKRSMFFFASHSVRTSTSHAPLDDERVAEAATTQNEEALAWWRAPCPIFSPSPQASEAQYKKMR